MMSRTRNISPLAVTTAVFLAAVGAAARAEDMPDGAVLFRQQCAACHSTVAGDPPRQGPNLAGVFGRKAGSAPGFTYSAGFTQANFTWDAAHLDAYLSDPQAVIPGAVMPYRQKKPEIRQAIIQWLKDQR